MTTESASEFIVQVKTPYGGWSDVKPVDSKQGGLDFIDWLCKPSQSNWSNEKSDFRIVKRVTSDVEVR